MSSGLFECYAAKAVKKRTETMKYWIRIPIALLISVLAIRSASGQNSRLATASDVARYLAGMPVSDGSPLASLTRDPQWLPHSNALNLSFPQKENRPI